MNGYMIVRKSGDLAGGIVRAPDQGTARNYAGDDVQQLVPLRDDVATAMGVPEDEGYHDDALHRWVTSETDIFGKLLQTS